MRTRRLSRGVRRTVRSAASGLALSAVLLVAVPAHSAPAPSPARDGLDQTLDPDQGETGGRAVLDNGHVDIGPRYRDGRWTIRIHDGAAVPPVWRSPDDTVLRIRDTATQQVPDDDAYAFLGRKPGDAVHVVPQTQQPGVVWIGWNTQDPGVMRAITRGVTMHLRGVQGPGQVTVYLQSGNLGAPQVLWNSTKRYPQPLWVETNTHTHASWVFGEPGVYLLAVGISADLADGSTVTGDAILRFAVGDATDPDEARTAVFTEPLADTSARPARGTPDDAAGGSGTAPWLVLGPAAGGLLIVGVLVGVALRGAAVRRRAERQYDPGSTVAPTAEGRNS